ncbi:rhodanese-like domain-containing protein 11, chloroplastic isoform X1 [Senna tora]|uniref:Rhodanese-like domain-containing protein 11, chloroplastic isoform X1 n=1 Tax=Senna tora TaxID=362788 RepID=A0A834X5K3_9FABA|nr:rhodanese-like domain-containing protein 11, chloroplastic isoform X1 [Senna tora]
MFLSLLLLRMLFSIREYSRLQLASCNQYETGYRVDLMTRFDPLNALSRTFHFRKRVIRAQDDNEDYELKQMRDMAAARKRWEALIREGKVKVLTPREAGYAVQLSNKPLLDVRPTNEHKKAWVKGSTWIPIFDVDNKLDAGNLAKKVTNFVMGGWWSGMPTLSYDSQFLAKVEQKFPRDTDLIVACQKGLRSLAACEILYNAGYKNLFWVQGGLEAAEDEACFQFYSAPLINLVVGPINNYLSRTDLGIAQFSRKGYEDRLWVHTLLLGVAEIASSIQLGRCMEEVIMVESLPSAIWPEPFLQG